MNVAPTQAESYSVMHASLADLTQQQKIVRFLDREGPHIRDDIATALALRTSSVTARLNELVKTGEVRESDIYWNPETRRHVLMYAVS